MISVIVPVYNVEKYIRKCLDSIVNQTYKDLEIILVDDGSTDGSGAICDEYAQSDNRIKVIHKENGGLSSARNAGLQVAQGEYIGFIDSDDFIHSEMYEKLLDRIQKTKTDVCMCGCKIVAENGEILSEDIFSNELYDVDGIMNNVVLPLRTSVCNKLYARAVIEEVNFSHGKIHGEDLIFHLKFLTRGIRFSSITGGYYYYIKHANSITTRGFSNKSFDEVYCKDRAYDIVVEKFPEYQKQAEIWRFRARMNLIRRIYKANVENEYSGELNTYKQYVYENYPKVKSKLKKKERLEVALLKSFTCVYKRLAKNYR